jgi:hypothetical protein
MKRVKDWRSRFDEELEKIRLQPFDWETQHDCVFGLVARLVEAMIDEPQAREFAGKYDTAEGALRVMKKAGYDSLADAVAARFPEIHPSQARIGDVIAYKTDTPFKYALGVVNGERAFVLREDGVGTMDILEADRAFRIG